MLRRERTHSTLRTNTDPVQARWHERLTGLTRIERHILVSARVEELDAIIAERPTHNFMNDMDETFGFSDALRRDVAAHNALHEKSILKEWLLPPQQ